MIPARSTGRWIDDLIVRAAEQLPPPVARYLAIGAGEGITLAEASPAWDAARFAPRILRTVTEVDLVPDLAPLGLAEDAPPLRLPLGIAPLTLQRAAHPEGELATARAAAEVGVPFVVSSNTATPFADIGETGAHWWLQVYLPPDRLAAGPLLRRAVRAGARAVVLTADTPVVARKYDDVAAAVWDVAEPGWVGAELDEIPERTRANQEVGAPWRLAEGTDRQREKATDLGPHDIGWLRETTGLPVLVKGVLRADDARRCRDAGAAGVWVSNHGGRQFDGALPTARALERVADAVPDAPVLVDGGIRSARHLAAAFGGGAGTAFLGRPVLAALTLGGAAGVVELFERLAEDLTEAMRLLGTPSWRDLPAVVDRGGRSSTDPGEAAELERSNRA